VAHLHPTKRPARAMPRAQQHRYLLFYKPYNVLSSFTDPEGRPTLASYVPVPGVYAAGRLDRESEGLMLLTDDGRLAHMMTHPRYKLPKTYLVQVEGVPGPEALDALRSGVIVKGERTAPAEVELLTTEPPLPPRSTPIRYRASIPTAWLRIVLREGRKRQIRHMTAAVGHPTLRLVRIAIGPLTLWGVAGHDWPRAGPATLPALEPGQWRDLTPDELASLWKALSRAGRNWRHGPGTSPRAASPPDSP
jgi:23S rRNA pseudouridine2457 synthase